MHVAWPPFIYSGQYTIIYMFFTRVYPWYVNTARAPVLHFATTLPTPQILYSTLILLCDTQCVDYI
jgi:hypothetical protein